MTMDEFETGIIYLTYQDRENSDSSRNAGTIERYKGRGVFVPKGLSVEEIMIGAEALEEQFDVAPYTSRDFAISVLLAVKGHLEKF